MHHPPTLHLLFIHKDGLLLKERQRWMVPCFKGRSHLRLPNTVLQVLRRMCEDFV
uniref:Uncharacterized protein n=1 Tax=Anguilla anguilla TaxID=7936 RepID=A0A0E9Y1H6_ANGAN